MRELHRVYAHDTEHDKYYKLLVSWQWMRRNDNGALISCGLDIPRDISRRQLAAVQHVEVSRDEWNHSGCLSRCILRGDSDCKW